MSHALDFSRGKAAIAYTGETPWHGYGQVLTPGAPIETWIKESQLDWRAEKAQVQFVPDGGKVPVEFPNRTVIYRTDTKRPLGLVSNSHFKIVQPAEVLEFYRDLVDTQGYQLETAGALKGGARIWALAKVGKSFTVGGKGKKSDEIGSYLLLATGLDGGFSTTAKLTSVRVVCNNTLGMAIPTTRSGKTEKTDAGKGVINIPHRQHFDAQAVKEELGILPKQIEAFREVVSELSKMKLSDRNAENLFATLLLKGREDSDDNREKVENKLKDLMLAYKKGPGADLPSADGTAWGAVNAVTYYVDHVVGRGVDTRLNKAWFGANDRLKNQALKLAMQQAKMIPVAA